MRIMGGQEAVGKVQPSAKREGFATIPDVTWNDVGSLGSVRKELEFSISRPIKYPEVYQVCELRFQGKIPKKFSANNRHKS
jgi:SpoVK/Ycf46/Vps4 family AAA+-type ATPase